MIHGCLQSFRCCFARAQTHDTHRPKKCLRPGSASGLNAGSHPIGRRPTDMLDCRGAVVRLDLVTTDSNRSALLVRLTEISKPPLLAACGVLAEQKVATAKLPSTAVAIVSLRAVFIAGLPPLWRSWNWRSWKLGL